MASKKITFDPDAGVAYAANFNMLGGANFIANFEIVGTSGTAFDLTGYSGSSQMTKSVSIGSTANPAATFNVGFTSAADGRMRVSLGGTETKTISEGRYVYDVIVSSGTTFYRIVDGTILVQPGISSISAL
tara:strand:- start:37 stop:429 length:393 start_codon:yes stop_codon:yes gene_type:complete